MGLLNITSFYAKIFDENGKKLKDVWFSKFNKTFSFNSQYTFNIKLDEGSYEDIKGVLWDKRFYFYNISHPDPLKLDKKCEPIIDPEIYNIQLETNMAKKLNNTGKKSLLDKLEFKHIIIGGGILVFLYFLLTGQIF